MLGHDPYFHKTFRRAIIGFAKVFNNIFIVRRLDDGSEERRIKVPITYGPKEKYIYRTMQDEDLGKAVKMILPRITFQIQSLDYNSTRKKNQTNLIRKQADGLSDDFTYTSVTYDLIVEMSVIARTQDDAQQIIEQILPFFKPEYTISINALPALDLKDDVPISIQSASVIDNYDGDWQEQRNIIWNLTFKMPVNFYGPVRSKKIIKTTQTDYLIPEPGTGEITDEVVAKTPRSARETLEVVPLDALSDEEYDILQTIEYFDDGKKFNPTTLQDEPIDEE